MPDDGHDLQFGFFLDPTMRDPGGLSDVARTLDDPGSDPIGIRDHPCEPHRLDALAPIGFLPGRTQRVRFFPDVANPPLRLPAMLAKHIASLDLLNGGRIEPGFRACTRWRRCARPSG